MVGILESIFLGILQGLTEWFPVSSSGHLVLFQRLLGIDVPIAYNVYLHLGTLVVLFAFFWKDILAILKDVMMFNFKTRNGLMGLYIIVGSFATLILGLTFYDFFGNFFEDIYLLGYAFLFTGSLLFLSKYITGKRKFIGLGSAISIGLAQGISLIPGVSRSGTTISAGMLSGVEKEEVARFSFLLSIPAVLGASVLDTVRNYDVILIFLENNFVATMLGVLFSAVVGWFSLKGLLWIIKRGNFHYFSYYCFFLGILILTKVIT